MKTSFIKCSRASDKFPPFSFLVGNRSVIVSQDDLSLVKEKTDVEAAPRLNRQVCGMSLVSAVLTVVTLGQHAIGCY